MIVAVDHVLLAAPPGPSTPAGALRRRTSQTERQLRSYYVGVLGMTEILKPPVLAARGGCWFQAGQVQLHLGIETDFRPPAKAHPGLRVRDIAAYADRLEAHGAPVTWDDTLPGHRRFYSEDPVGNRLEFLEPIG